MSTQPNSDEKLLVEQVFGQVLPQGMFLSSILGYAPSPCPERPMRRRKVLRACLGMTENVHSSDYYFNALSTIEISFSASCGASVFAPRV